MSNPRRRALAAALLAVRKAREPSGNVFAKSVIGWSQSTVSRVESGVRMPLNDDEVIAWARACGVDPAPLLEMFAQARERTVKVNRASGGVGVLAAAGELAELEVGSSFVAEYQPMLVPGLAQTPEYTREWLTQPGRPTLAPDLDVEAVVEARHARQARVLDGGRRVVVAMNETALDAVYGTVATLEAQREHLRALAGAGVVEVYVEPRTAALAVMRGFELLDDLVSLEDVEGLRLLGAPEAVETYRTALERVIARSRGTDAVRPGAGG